MNTVTSTLDQIVAAQNFKEFYPLYLTEHSNITCRRLHFIGTTGVLILLFIMIATQNWSLIFAGLVFGYGCAWIGHFVFEKNKPASFKRPLYSFMGDWVMYKDILRGKVKIF